MYFSLTTRLSLSTLGLKKLMLLGCKGRGRLANALVVGKGAVALLLPPNRGWLLGLLWSRDCSNLYYYLLKLVLLKLLLGSS